MTRFGLIKMADRRRRVIFRDVGSGMGRIHFRIKPFGIRGQCSFNEGISFVN